MHGMFVANCCALIHIGMYIFMRWVVDNRNASDHVSLVASDSILNEFPDNRSAYSNHLSEGHDSDDEIGTYTYKA